MSGYSYTVQCALDAHHNDYVYSPPVFFYGCSSIFTIQYNIRVPYIIICLYLLPGLQLSLLEVNK